VTHEPPLARREAGLEPTGRSPGFRVGCEPGLDPLPTPNLAQWVPCEPADPGTLDYRCGGSAGICTGFPFSRTRLRDHLSVARR